MIERPRRGAWLRHLGRSVVRAGLAALVALGAAGPAVADPALPLAAQLAGKTLSAVVYVPRAPGEGGGSLRRLMVQAYLAADGRGMVREWVGARDRYSTPVQTSWSLTGDRLCFDLPEAGRPTRKLCAKVHVWGPRIAGIGTRPYAMLDGDIRPGNAIAGTR